MPFKRLPSPSQLLLRLRAWFQSRAPSLSVQLYVSPRPRRKRKAQLVRRKLRVLVLVDRVLEEREAEEQIESSNQPDR